MSLVAALLGTAQIALVAAGIAVPAGVAAGVWLGEHGVDGSAARYVRALVVHVTAIPSVLFGLFGAVALVPVLGGGALTAGISLGLLALAPIAVATEQAVTDVPEHFRLGARALGATRFQVISGVVLPSASRRIVAGAALALSRCAGETAPLLLILAAAPGSELTALPLHLFALASAGAAREAWVLAIALVIAVLIAHAFAARLRRAA